MDTSLPASPYNNYIPKDNNVKHILSYDIINISNSAVRGFRLAKKMGAFLHEMCAPAYGTSVNFLKCREVGK